MCLGLAAAAAEAQAPPFPGQHTAQPPDWKFPAWPTGCSRFQGHEQVACLEFIAFDFGQLARYAPANALLAPPRPDEPRVVFFGDSITDGWSNPAQGGFFPGKPYLNRGIGGQTTTQMLLRFRADVLALRPKAVLILAGTNDVAGNSGPAALSSIQDNLATLCELAQLHGVRVVLASLLPVADGKPDPSGRPIRQTRERPPEKLQALNRWLSDYARQNGHAYLDYYSTLADAEGRFRAELTDDGLHPNAAGYALMAPLAEKAIAGALGAGR